MSERETLTVKAPEAKAARLFAQKRRPEISPPPTSPYEQVTILQRSIGNRAVERLFRSGILQAKLKIGQPNDVHEQEADRIAEQVMRMPNSGIQMKPT